MTPPAAPTRSCVFCGSTGPLTLEHAISKVVAAQLGIQQMGGMSKGPGAGTMVRPMRSVDVVVRGVCASCNGGWMSASELAFLEAAQPALVGNEIILTPAQQGVVSRWAVKTALMLHMGTMLATSGEPVPPDHATALFQTGDPAPATTVWMARVEADGTLVSWLKPTTFSAAGDAIGYQIAFSVGYALFVVTGWDSATSVGATTFRMNPSMADYFIQVWPTEADSVRWPPPAVLTQSDLDLVWPSRPVS